MKAKYLNLQNNLPTTHRDLQNAENKKIASLAEHKKDQVDQAPLPKNDQPDLDSVSPINEAITGRQNSKNDAQFDAQLGVLTPSLDAQNKNDAQKNFDAQSEHAYPSRTDRERVSLRLSKEKYDQLQTWCFLHNMKFQKAIEKALDLLFDAQFENDAQPDWASRRPHRSDLDESDDLIDDKLSLIIQFFEKWTGTKIKDKEKFKYSYEGIRHLDIKVIEIGILLSVFRSKTKINSLNYCLNTIQETAEAKIGNPDDYIKNIIKHLEKKNKNTVKG